MDLWLTKGWKHAWRSNLAASDNSWHSEKYGPINCKLIGNPRVGDKPTGNEIAGNPDKFTATVHTSSSVVRVRLSNLEKSSILIGKLGDTGVNIKSTDSKTWK